MSALLDAPDPFRPFVPLLAHATDPEDPIPLLSSTVLTTLIAASSAAAPAVDRAMPVLLSYLSMLAKAPDSGKQDIAVLEFSSLLRGKKLREFFWRQRAETVEPLINILIAAAGVAPNGDSSSTMWSGAGTNRTVEGSFGGGVGLQLLYHVLLVLWQLSFESDTIGDVLEEYAVLLKQKIKMKYKILKSSGKANNLKRVPGRPSFHPIAPNITQRKDDSTSSVNTLQSIINQ